MSAQDTSEFAAAGSLPRLPPFARPSKGRRLRLIVELIVLFALVPLALAYAVHGLRISLLLLLIPLLVGLILFLTWDRTFSLRGELTRGVREPGSILGIFILAGSAVTAWIWLNRPAAFLSFPSRWPELWLAVMILYPLLSALPQEFVFRTFFFHRYGPLFSNCWLAIGVNGALFGFAHLIFGTWASVLLSAALGLLLAWRYARTRSLWTAWIEHTLYGQLVFTVGSASISSRACR